MDYYHKVIFHYSWISFPTSINQLAWHAFPIPWHVLMTSLARQWLYTILFRSTPPTISSIHHHQPSCPITNRNISATKPALVLPTFETVSPDPLSLLSPQFPQFFDKMISRTFLLLAAAAVGSTTAFTAQPMGVTTRTNTQLSMVSLRFETTGPLWSRDYDV